MDQAENLRNIMKHQNQIQPQEQQHKQSLPPDQQQMIQAEKKSGHQLGHQTGQQTEQQPVQQTEQQLVQLKEQPTEQQADSKFRNARVITVTSGKGGVGKSNTSVNLAMQFQKLGKKVIIVDADFGLANVEVMFGVIPKYNMGDLIYKGMEISEIISEGPNGIRFISGGSGIAELANLDEQQVKRLISKLAEIEDMADIVIFDTGAGISPSVMGFLTASPETILVTTPEPTSITDSYALLKMLRMSEGFDEKRNKVKLIANRVQNEKEGKNLHEKLNMVASKFLQIEIELLGIIPYDNSINKAVMRQKPVSVVYPDSNAARQFEIIARKMVGTKEQENDNKRGIKGYFKAVFAKKR